MKKIFLTIISLALAFVCVACSSNGADVPNLDDYPDKKQETEKAPETGKYILKQGSSDYSIIVSDSASTDVNFAAVELQLFFNEATGIKLPIKTDNSITYTAESKIICVGENDVSLAAGVALSDEERIALESSGLKVVQRDSSLFLFGGEDRGSVYAVYEWLERELNYEFFTENIWTIDKNVKDIPLRAYNVQVVPDYDVRFYCYSRFHYSYTLSNRLKLNYPLNYRDLKIITKVKNQNGDVVLTEKDQATDGQLERTYLSKAVYGEGHPDWYSGNDQMCFTGSAASSSFNETEYDALTTELANILRDSFIADKEGNHVVFGGYDANNYCECATCQQKNLEYGSICGSFVKLCNDVRLKVDQWMDSEEGAAYRREWSLEFLAYAAYQEPPVKLNANGEFVPTITCVEGVQAYYAPIKTELLVSMEHEFNKEHLQRLENWAKVSTHGMSAWLYATNFKNYMCPFDPIKNLSDSLKLFKEVKCDYMFIQGQGQSGIMTGYNMLNVYICSKAMWNVNVDVNELIDRWFTVVYGEAKEIMEQAFTEVRINLYDMCVNKGFKNQLTSGFRNSEQTKFWNKDLLLRWINAYNNAIATVERYGGSDTQILMIRAERISPVYYLLKLYHSEMTPEEINEYGDMYFGDVGACQLSVMRENAAAETFDSFKKEIGYSK